MQLFAKGRNANDTFAKSCIQIIKVLITKIILLIF